MNTLPPAVETRQLSKHYGEVKALQQVDLSIAAGEYYVLLGPSGGGKTTLLRTIGGFHKPTEGQVLLHGQDVSALPPNKRPTTMVFQSYALFPHMTVAQNVGYGLVLAKKSRDEVASRASAMLEMVGLTGYDNRKPHELSGGQQQRVQLARSLVLDRDILLLDEPLAALDAQLRKDMCLELKHLQEQVGITFIHVTHNQEEAMTVADRIALIANGKLVEQGSARDIYESPAERFTAGFVGENNLLDGEVDSVAGQEVTVNIAGHLLSAPVGKLNVAKGTAVSLSIRSELLTLHSATDSDKLVQGYSLPATYRETVYLGLTTSHRAALDNGIELHARLLSAGNERQPETGAPVMLAWNPGDARLHLR